MNRREEERRRVKVRDWRGKRTGKENRRREEMRQRKIGDRRRKGGEEWRGEERR